MEPFPGVLAGSPPDVLLKRVSRSFYLSLRILPPAVRPTLSLAYLLARASDSIADCMTWDSATRAQWLRGLPAAWAGGVTAEGLPAAERDLLAALPALLRRLDASPDKDLILEVWRVILSGQIFDIERFEDGGALEFDEAVRYTGLVAGCVGRFWTSVCLRQIHDYSREDPAVLCERGFAFGCGLQWVNILRDRHADARAGRIYVRDQDFARALGEARTCLGEGRLYAAAVRPRRVRAACLLPLDLGFRTLDLVEANPAAQRVKLPRSTVWVALLRALMH